MSEGYECAISGVGLFLNSADMQETPSTIVSNLKASGAKWAALWVESPDGRKVSPSTLKEVRIACQDAGIDVWVWAFPDSRTPEVSAKWLAECAELCVGVILDIELPFKGKKAAAVRYIQALKSQLDSVSLVAFTSYPFGHPTLPWKEFEQYAQIGMPQLYTSAEKQSNVERAYTHYKGYRTIVPIVATYIEDSARLASDLNRVCIKNGQLRTQAVAVWVMRTTDAAERSVLKSFSDTWFKKD